MAEVVRDNDGTQQDGLARLEVLADDLQTEIVKLAEGSDICGIEGSVQREGLERDRPGLDTLILPRGPHPSPTTTRRHQSDQPPETDYTPNCEEPSFVATAPRVAAPAATG